MLKKIAIVLVITSSLLGLFPQRIVSQELQISQLSVYKQIDYFAELYGVDNSLAHKIINCESQYNINAKGDGGRAFSLLQYHKSSFERHNKLFGEELDYYSSYDQIKLGMWAISQGFGREWTSYRAIMNGGTYSFYSTLLQKYFTVTCK